MNLKEAHVLVAVPMYGGLCHSGFLTSMLKLAVGFSKAGIQLSTSFVSGESLITRARNELAAQFWSDARYTHLQFLDADLTFDPRDIAGLIAHDVDIVGPGYPKKTPNPEYTFEPLRVDGDKANVRGDLLECKHVGTGGMLIKREVLSKMRDAHPDLRYVMDGDSLRGCTAYDLFSTMIVNDDPEYGDARLLSEDWAFCYRARKLGFQVWCDYAMRWQHTGTFTYDQPAPGIELGLLK